ncbi:sulfotransferase domain-containing protein [Magnetococcales bacterium HHB-1]
MDTASPSSEEQPSLPQVSSDQFLNESLLLAEEAYKMGQWNQIRTFVHEIKKHHPHHPGVHFLGALLAQHEKKYDQAIDLYTRARLINPQESKYAFHQAFALIAKGRGLAAEEALKEAIKYDPNHPQANYLLGSLYQHMGRFEDSSKHIEKDYEAENTLHRHRIWLNMLLQQWWEADPEFKTMFQESPLDLNMVALWNRCIDIMVKQKVFANNKGFCCYSYPKCGTHLLAEIMVHISGKEYFFPSVDEILSMEACPPLPQSHQFLIGHWYPNHDLVKFMAGNNLLSILQLRDPRDQVISFYFYYRDVVSAEEDNAARLVQSKSKEAMIQALAGSRTTIEEYPSMPQRLMAWLELWLVAGTPMRIFTFEEMVNQKAKAIQDLAKFTSIPISQEKIAAIVEESDFKRKSKVLRKRNPEATGLKRKGVSGDWKNHLDAAHIAGLKELFGLHLIDLGYESDLLW